jgi:hypothetical protein
MKQNSEFRLPGRADGDESIAETSTTLM